MSSRKKTPSATQNWVKLETINEYKKQAKKTVEEENKKHEGMKQVTLPHPTLKKTFILKYI